jgi:hypothetical protein
MKESLKSQIHKSFANVQLGNGMGQQPYITFVKGKGLLDLEKYARLKTLANYEAIMNTD